MVSMVLRGVSDNHVSPDSRGRGSWERGSGHSAEKVTPEKALEKGFKVELELPWAERRILGKGEGRKRSPVFGRR